MKNISIIILFILILTSPIYAQSTHEIKLNAIFLKSFDIAVSENFDLYHLIVDYSVEIIKYKPDSLEIVYLSVPLNYVMDTDSQKKQIQYIYNLYKDKYLSDLENLETDLPEKMILALMLRSGLHILNYEITPEEQALYKTGTKILEKIMNEHSVKNYATVAGLLLQIGTEGTALHYGKIFKEKFPEYPFMPKIDLDVFVCENSLKENYQTVIDMPQEFIEKYKKINTPFGYKMVIDCYASIIWSCIEIKDFKKANEYLDLIKKEAPNFWGIKHLENIIFKVQR